MTRLFESLRLWQKSLIPLVLCALVADGLSAKLIMVLQQTDKEYSDLLEHESSAALWAARMNATVLDLGRNLWRAVADKNADETTERRAIEALLPVFAERAKTTASSLNTNPLAAKLPEIERNFATTHRLALEGFKLSRKSGAEAAVQFLRQNFSAPLEATRKQTNDLADAIGRNAGQHRDRLSANAATARTQAIYLAAGSIAAVLALGLWITQLVSSNILQVTQASAETGTAASQVQATSADVSQQAEALRDQVATFLTQVRAA